MSKTKAPSFEVLGQRYRVREYAHLDDPEVGPLNGMTALDDQQVRLATRVGAGTRDETYLHEVLHVVFHKGQIVTDGAAQEDLVKRLAPLLLDTLRRNPRMVRRLMRRR